MNIDNSKNQLNHRVNIVIRKFRILQIICQILFFSSQAYPRGILYTARSFLHKLKILIYCPFLYWNQKPVALIFFVNVFVNFVKLLNRGKVIHSVEYSFFLIHVKSDKQWTEKTILALLSMEIINEWYRTTADIQLRRFRFKGLKLV